MDELVTSLVERNIVKLTNIVENTTCPNSLKPEYLSLLATFLIQKAGCSPSPKTIEWLYFLTFKYPNILRDLTENFAESIHSMRDRFGSAEKKFLYEIKGKMSLFQQVRGDAPEVSTATPEQQYQDSEEDSEELNYQEFSVIQN